MRFSHQTSRNMAAPPSSGQTIDLHLPLEVVARVVHFLRQQRHYESLAQMAQANTTFYELVISQLYETITITRTNLGKFQHGHGSRYPAIDGYIDESDSSPPQTRKDNAAKHCRRMIIDVTLARAGKSAKCILDRPIDDHYGNVEELVLSTRALGKPTSKDLSLGELSSYFPSSKSVNAPEGEVQVRLKARRVVLHLPLDHEWSNTPELCEEWKSILRGRDVVHLAFHDIYPIPPDGPDWRGWAVSRWLYFALFPAVVTEIFHFPNYDYDMHSHLLLYNIPELIIEPEDRPDTSEEAAVLALEIIQDHLRDMVHDVPWRGGEERLKAMMKCIQLQHGEYENQEYPVTRPRPVIQSYQPLIRSLIESGHRAAIASVDRRRGRGFFGRRVKLIRMIGLVYQC